MGERPKRRMSKDNPYKLKEINNTYIIIFKDGCLKEHTVEVNKQVFEIMNEFELDDLAVLNEYDRHIEHLDLTEEQINNRAFIKSESLEDEIIKKSCFEDLKNAIEMLPENQKRRIKKYYFEDLSMADIAIQEKCSKVAIKYSLECAISNLKKNLKK